MTTHPAACPDAQQIADREEHDEQYRASLKASRRLDLPKPDKGEK